MVAASNQIFVKIGAESDLLLAAAFPSTVISTGNEWRVVNPDAAHLGRRDQPEVPGSVALEHSREQLYQRHPADRRAWL